MVLSGPLQLILTLYAIYTSLLLTKQNLFRYFDAGLEHMNLTASGVTVSLGKTLYPLLSTG